MSSTDKKSVMADIRGQGVRDNANLLARFMIAPAILYIAIMIGLPFVLAVLYSLSDATTGDPRLHIIGLQNFRNVLADPVFRIALKNTFFFAWFPRPWS